VISSILLGDRQKRVSDYLSAAPADSIFAARCGRTDSALPFRAAYTKPTSLIMGKEAQKRDTERIADQLREYREFEKARVRNCAGDFSLPHVTQELFAIFSANSGLSFCFFAPPQLAKSQRANAWASAGRWNSRDSV
jgi:hypothetical protein